jgi:hypothetical protein
MASMIESIMGMLSGDALSKISQQIGIPEDKAKQALPDVLGVLTGALAKESSQKKGAQSLSKALSEDHDGSILNNLSDYISNYQAGNGNGILGHTLGNNRPAVERGLSQKTGLDMGTIGNLLTMAAPIIMGALGKTQRQNGLDAGSLSNLLGQESSQAQSLIPDLGGILGQILGGGQAQTQGQNSQQTQQQPSAAGTNKKRSGCASVLIVLVIAVVVFFLLRSCGIL